ncbi:MAG: WD40 repeat domain-containing protein [Pirellulaceae bacterium]
MDRRLWIEGLWMSLLGGIGIGSCASLRTPMAHASPMLADRLISAPRFGHFQLPPAPGETTPPILTALLSIPDQPWIACSGDDYWIRSVDPKDQRIVEAWPANRQWISHLRWDARTRSIVGCGRDGKVWRKPMNGSPSATRWDLPISLKDLHSIPWSDVRELAWIASDDRGDVVSIDATTDEIRMWWSDRSQGPWRIALHSEQKVVALAGRTGEVVLLEWPSGKEIVRRRLHRAPIRAMAIDPDRNLLFTASEDRVLQALDLASHESHRISIDDPTPWTAMIMADRRLLALGGQDGTIRWIDREERIEVDRWEGHQGTLTALAVHQDLLISASYDATIRFWPLADLGHRLAGRLQGRRVP